MKDIYKKDYKDFSFSIHKIKDRKILEILEKLKKKKVRIKDFICCGIEKEFNQRVKDGDL